MASNTSIAISISDGSLEWKDLRYSVGKRQPRRYGLLRGQEKRMTVLHGVSGQVKTGEMLALMGPSGSGKSTLLAVLAGRIPKRCRLESGQVIFNGKPVSKAVMRHCGFVFQDDLLLPMLTVRETIEYAAKLRMPQSCGDEARAAAVDRTLATLGLNTCAHSFIGSEKDRGVSGGERKRVTVGVELVSMPTLLFLDEPTSGLDATSALTLVQVLREYVTDTAGLVVCSVHQPRSNIFSAFDRLLLLSLGNTVYHGSLKHAVSTLEKATGTALPSQTNPADWLIDLVMGDIEGSTRWAKQAQEEADKPAVLSELNGGGCEREVSEPAFRTSSWWQYRVLLERCAKQERFNLFNFVNSFQLLAVAVIASIVWGGSSSVRDLQGVLFFMIMNTAFNSQNNVLRLFPTERTLMQRERRCGSYRMLPYFLARSTADTMSTFSLPIVYTIIIYFSTGLRRELGAFFSFLALLLLSITTAQSFGIFLSILLPDFALATCVSFVLILLNMLFGGFYVTVARIPEWIRWVRFLSYLHWSYIGALENEFGGRTFPCDTPSDDCVIDGDELIRERGGNEVTVGGCIGLLGVFTVVFRALAYLCLRYNVSVD